MQFRNKESKDETYNCIKVFYTCGHGISTPLINTLVNVYVDLLVFTDLNDRYSNLFLNAYINRHAHTEYLKMI